MKCLNASLDFAILGSDSFMLPQVIGPRFSHKGLDVSLRVCSIARYIPTYRTIPQTYPPHVFHSFQEFPSDLRIDSIFNDCNSGSF